MQVVADQEDADALALELEDQLGDLPGLGGAQRRRGLVHDQHAGIEIDRPRNRDRLALAAGKRFHRLLEAAEMRVEPAHHLAGLGLHGRIVERAPGRQQFAPEEDVGGGIDIVGERERLVDRLDAIALGIARASDRDRLAIDPDLAGIGPVSAGQDLDQRRLAGAVVPEQPDDLAGMEIDADRIDGLDAAEGDRDVAHLDEGAGHVHGAHPSRLR